MTYYKSNTISYNLRSNCVYKNVITKKHIIFCYTTLYIQHTTQRCKGCKGNLKYKNKLLLKMYILVF
jgi:hypothetical protein